jgi:hypothetical protein
LGSESKVGDSIAYRMGSAESGAQLRCVVVGEEVEQGLELAARRQCDDVAAGGAALGRHGDNDHHPLAAFLRQAKAAVAASTMQVPVRPAMRL